MTLTDDEKDVAIRSALAQLPLGHTVWDGHRASYDAGLAAIPREPTEHDWRTAAWICDRCQGDMPSVCGCAAADCQVRKNDAAQGGKPT